MKIIIQAENKEDFVEYINIFIKIGRCIGNLPAWKQETEKKSTSVSCPVYIVTHTLEESVAKDYGSLGTSLYIDSFPDIDNHYQGYVIAKDKQELIYLCKTQKQKRIRINFLSK